MHQMMQPVVQKFRKNGSGMVQGKKFIGKV